MGARGGNLVMPDQVGLELGGPQTRYILQIHYNNTANYEDALDNSGVGFCAIHEPRPETAGILTLGTIGINIPPGAQGHEVTGTCGAFDTSTWPELHVIGASPHMHEFGRGFRTEIQRASGGTEMLTDVPIFNFSDQRMYLYEPEILIKPGDTLNSTCVYDNPTDQTVTFGEGTGDEMCFNFALVYPVDQISNRNCGILF